jgi:xylulokinase
MVGTGAFTSVEEACAAVVRETETLDPHPAESSRYAHDYEIYRALYPALKPVFTRISDTLSK